MAKRIKNTGRRKRKNPPWITAVQIAFVALLLLWMQFAVQNEWISRVFVASPSQIVEELLYMLNENSLWPHLNVSLREVALGYAISAVGGIGLGVVFVAFPLTEKLLDPLMAAVMAVPKTAIMPLLIVWFGVGFKSKVVLVVLFCFFNVLYNTVTGAKQTRTEHLKLARVFEASRTQTVFKVLLPSALPSIFNGLRVTAATAITGVVFAEMAAARNGLGYLLNESQAVLNTPRLYLVIILVTILSVLFVGLVNLAERIICRRWKPDAAV
ncbi:ABC transporter permease [Saccharibacillus sp. CPCC 101409]|uniref:ABC transporter permease n=1 Tax=Saccharibacillus sp. CPCC 101409 TaxID=3058041 RepID=UPI00267161B5|nr:ABC transporter permease [Saccharibacillus sp. CPCC 101409]MDO3409277.1 ABC transporter permease [Saccharibacillus sp. CPCC 101409]